ncbi:DUF4440 domain-containing protein [Halobacillus sp. SY10]|uniref:DUF4440 domain-containing protein n=1 Tax=Halobacillus aidingensis TaxID=240303 RepID=A0A1H0FUD4_HALAD|nr:hypothetical protein SAMN05421677_102116 [Halobacillus aidingensis]
MSLKEKLKALETHHLQLSTRKSTEGLDYILADDFWEIGSSGVPYDKKFCLEQGVLLTEMALDHYEIQPLSEDTVLATYYVTDTTRNRNTLRSSIWKKIDERWQLYFHQGTMTDLLKDEYKEMRGL